MKTNESFIPPGDPRQQRLLKRSGVSKYRNKKTVYNGVKYDSKLEAQTAVELDLLLRANKILGYRRQVPFELLAVAYIPVGVYVADFVVQHFHNTYEVIECKGFETPVWKLKRKLLEARFKTMQYNHFLTVKKSKG